MKLLAVLCACALVAADRNGGEGKAPSTAELASGLGYLYRRFLTIAQPEQVKLQDALDVKWRRGMMGSIPIRSAWKATFDGTERNTFSQIYSIISPEMKGFDGAGSWIQNTVSDVMITWHHGAALKFHMLTDGGDHKDAVLGSPLHYDGAKFAVVIPKSTFCTVESTSDETFAFLSYVAIPGWTMEGHKEFSLKDMEAKFPDHSEMFKALATPGVSKSGHRDHDDHGHHDDHDDHDDDHHHGHHGHRSHRRR